MKGKTALIVYHSKRGKTAAYAREIAMFLWSKGLNIRLMSTTDFTPEKIEGIDYFVCGCWTSGWFVVCQYPHQIWKNFARSLPQPWSVPTLLFTTYRFRVGSMFRNMAKVLNIPLYKKHTLASKTGRLTEEQRTTIEHFLAQTTHSL